LLDNSFSSLVAENLLHYSRFSIAARLVLGTGDRLLAGKSSRYLASECDLGQLSLPSLRGR